MIDANYMIAALLRMLIVELSEPFCDSEKRKLYIEDFRNCFSITVSELNSKDMEDINTYMEFLIQHANDTKQLLTNLGGNISDYEVAEDNEDENINKRNRFIHHALADQQSQIADLLEMMDLTIEVVNLGIDELKKYLPAKTSDKEEKKLKNTIENVSE